MGEDAAAATPATDTEGLAATVERGGGPGPSRGPATGEIGVTAETGDPPGEVTPEIGNLDPRAAADLADYCRVVPCCAVLSKHPNISAKLNNECRLVCAELS